MTGNTRNKGGKPPSNSFAPGHRPWNKDLKGLRLSPATEFKKGHVPDDLCELGAVRIRIDKGGKPRAYVKTSQPNGWVSRTTYVWLASGRTVPKGHVLHHKNRDSTDDRIENLECLSRADHLREHRHEHDSEKKSASLRESWKRRKGLI